MASMPKSACRWLGKQSAPVASLQAKLPEDMRAAGWEVYPAHAKGSDSGHYRYVTPDRTGYFTKLSQARAHAASDQPGINNVVEDDVDLEDGVEEEVEQKEFLDPGDLAGKDFIIIEQSAAPRHSGDNKRRLGGTDYRIQFRGGDKAQRWVRDDVLASESWRLWVSAFHDSCTEVCMTTVS